MPPKKRVVDDEKQQLEEEAMAEWLTRGLNIKDFSMDKMLSECGKKFILSVRSCRW